jgi:hypothetical protein
MRTIRSAFIPVILLSLAACGGGGSDDDDDGGSTSTDPGVAITDSASLSEAASFENGTRVSGRAPVPTTASAASMEGPAEIALTTNSVTDLLFEVPLPDTATKIGAVFVEIEGSSEHFVIIPDETASRGSGIPNYTAHSDLASNGLTAQRVQCATRNPPCEGIRLVGQPLRSSSSRFTSTVNTRANVSTAIIANVSPPIAPTYDFSQIQPSRWTRPLQVNVRATPTGEGDLQFTLTWDTTADMDLHIFEPGGSEIAYYSRTSANGYLDVDDTNGFGPENVYYEDGHDAGSYRVEVHHFSGALPTNYTVTVTVNGSTSSYSGNVTTEDEEDLVTTVSSTGAAGSGSSSDDDDDSDTAGGSGTGDFCYDNYPSDPCDLLESQSTFSNSTFTLSNTCSGLGFSGVSETYDFGSTYGSFGYLATGNIGTVGTCYVSY